MGQTALSLRPGKALLDRADQTGGSIRDDEERILELLDRPERAPSVDIEDLDALRQELRDSVESEFPRQAEDALREYPGVA